ncbi:hypothetical protein GJ699_33275 [Duganella sp. FT80W]|uniref:Uncharacterized protein n=1 Tax=Duganella guangzhouensis TaxID=2666084 RepID=A0A6I2LAJ6_9BURK|nr:hypothetical protein [Duganella guangzhouensis]MRW94840.1 hypothetical protein [Duganella guangzhouensis]
MDTNHHIYTELAYQLRKREAPRTEEEITLIALKEWMARNFSYSAMRGYQWKELFLPHGAMLRLIHRGMTYYAE